MPLCTFCRKPTNIIPTSIKKEVSVERLSIDNLIRESKKSSGNNFDDIPLKFYELATSITKSSDDLLINYEDSKIWIEFGQWLGFKEPIKKKDVQKHLEKTWKRFEYVLDVRKLKDPKIPDEVLEINGKGANIKKREMISSAQNIDTKNFRFVTNPECIVDKLGKTLVHLGELYDDKAVSIATKAINDYYLHMLQKESHRSESFWKNLAERFGALTTYNTLPYTTSDTASAHNIEHQDCVNKLLYALQPISQCVNKFVERYYEHYYAKLNKLTWGPFAPKPFGIFPTIAINFNVISKYHWDSNDNSDGLCFLIPLGDFEGGELVFPQLQIVVKLKPGQIVAFPSCLLLHGNLPITKGIRFSIVYFVHESFFLWEKVLENLEEDLKSDTSNESQDFYYAGNLNSSRPLLKKAKKFQISEPTEDDALDKRRYKDGKYIIIL